MYSIDKFLVLDYVFHIVNFQNFNLLDNRYVDLFTRCIKRDSVIMKQINHWEYFISL